MGFRARRTSSQAGREFYKKRLYNKLTYVYSNYNQTQ